MAITVGKPWVIQGGSLARPWLPARVMECAGSAFFECRSEDNKLRAFLGMPRGDQCCRILSIIRQLRNQKVDALILEAMKANDPLGQYDNVAEVDRASTSADDLPLTVGVELPEIVYNDEVAGACKITCLVETAPKRCVSIELTADNLKYLRVATMALTTDHTDELHFAPNLSRRSKRPAETKIMLSSKRVRADYRRKALVVEYTDADDRKRKHSHKPKAWEADEIAQTEADLLAWKGENDNETLEDDAN